MHGTIVMIHGRWRGSWTWDRYAAVLEKRGWRCLRPVLRYHDVDPAGPPDPRLGEMSLLDYAADLEAFIRGLDAPPVLLGHSMGGLLSIMLAARCPVLLVSASDDRLTPASVLRKTAAFLGPRVTLREFPGHGHWVDGAPGWENIAGFVADWLEAIGHAAASPP